MVKINQDGYQNIKIPKYQNIKISIQNVFFWKDICQSIKKSKCSVQIFQFLSFINFASNLLLYIFCCCKKDLTYLMKQFYPNFQFFSNFNIKYNLGFMLNFSLTLFQLFIKSFLGSSPQRKNEFNSFSPSKSFELSIRK